MLLEGRKGWKQTSWEKVLKSPCPGAYYYPAHSDCSINACWMNEWPKWSGNKKFWGQNNPEIFRGMVTCHNSDQKRLKERVAGGFQEGPSSFLHKSIEGLFLSCRTWVRMHVGPSGYWLLFYNHSTSWCCGKERQILILTANIELMVPLPLDF